MGSEPSSVSRNLYFPEPTELTEVRIADTKLAHPLTSNACTCVVRMHTCTFFNPWKITKLQFSRMEAFCLDNFPLFILITQVWVWIFLEWITSPISLEFGGIHVGKERVKISETCPHSWLLASNSRLPSRGHCWYLGHTRVPCGRANNPNSSAAHVYLWLTRVHCTCDRQSRQLFSTWGLLLLPRVPQVTERETRWSALAGNDITTSAHTSLAEASHVTMPNFKRGRN